MVVWVAFGAGIGACLRYAVTLIGKRLWPTWPMATLVINTLGALVAGGFTGAAIAGSSAAFLLTGVCGGFTTFSTFMVDAVSLWQQRRYLALIGYYGGTMVFGVLAVAIGLWCGQRYF